MSEKSLSKFFISIVLPSLIAITLFIVSFYLVIIPMFEKSMMQRKKEMILELTNTAWSVLDEYHTEYKNNKYTLEEAKQMAITQIEKMRYGNEGKDYFWIIDHEPTMIMHPYRKELNNTNLSEYKDSHKTKLFVDAVQIVDSLGQGFIEYYWQWKDIESTEVPKLSFVKEFKSWNWILGTGIYLKDVNAEISILKNRLFNISGVIIGIIILILIYLIRQSLNIENKRREAERNLSLSRSKYKSLVDASTEGTLMFIEDKVVFANQKFIDKYIQSNKNILGLNFNKIFKADISLLLQETNTPNKSLNIETQIIFDDIQTNVVISLSEVTYSNKKGYIVIIKDINHQRQLEISSKKLSDEVEFSLQLMHQSIEPFIKEALFCDINDTIQDAASLMRKNNEHVIFITSNDNIIGVVNDNDLKNRALAEQTMINQPISGIMTSPVLSINAEALIYEASLRFKKKKVSHLLVKNEDGNFIGAISHRDCLEVQHNSLAFLIQQINNSETVKELKDFYIQLPLLISALVSSSDNIYHITRLITTISDSITCRLIQMGIDRFGKAPCKFSFIAMGSAGRSEQLLKTDQDNAIIYEDGFENANEYFLKLGEYINDNLNIIGYNSCKGFIMTKNPRWCQPLSTWKNYFTNWIEGQGVEDLLNCKIFFDLKCVYGSKSLTKKLRNHFTQKANHTDGFMKNMASSVLKHKPEFKGNKIDLKEVTTPIIGYLRIKALLCNINETNSIKRLYKIFEHDAITFEACEEIESSYQFLMHQRIKLQSKQLLVNETPENEIHIKTLTSIELSIIEKILKQIQNLQLDITSSFKTD